MSCPLPLPLPILPSALHADFPPVHIGIKVRVKFRMITHIQLTQSPNPTSVLQLLIQINIVPLLYSHHIPELQLYYHPPFTKDYNISSVCWKCPSQAKHKDKWVLIYIFNDGKWHVCGCLAEDLHTARTMSFCRTIILLFYCVVSLQSLDLCIDNGMYLCRRVLWSNKEQDGILFLAGNYAVLNLSFVHCCTLPTRSELQGWCIHPICWRGIHGPIPCTANMHHVAEWIN